MRSLAGSNGMRFMMLGATVMAALAANHSVVPSGLARTTSLPASVALAPGLLSTTTVALRDLPSAAANSRAPWSAGPPAA
ncbi:hypothetical protein D3C87_1371690 [compost metagenome]